MQVTNVVAGGAADQGGIKAGDVLLAVNGEDAAGVPAGDGQDYRFRELLLKHGAGSAVDITVRRGEEQTVISVTPQLSPEGRPLIGIEMGREILSTATVHPGFFACCGLAAQLCVREGGLILQSLKDLVTGGVGLDQMSGPVGVVSLVAQETREYGPTAYVTLLIFISVNLGLVNLMPIPGLDGAMIIMLLVEGVRRKSLSRKTETYIKLAGLIALFALFIYLTLHDILNIFTGR